MHNTDVLCISAAFEDIPGHQCKLIQRHYEQSMCEVSPIWIYSRVISMCGDS